MSLVTELRQDQLNVKVAVDRDAMGKAAALDVSSRLRNLLNEQARVNMIFAAAPSQSEFLHYLKEAEGIEWSRVHAFHLDEYVGLTTGHPQSFGEFLRVNVFSQLPFGKVHYIEPSQDSESVLKQYGGLLRENPIDIACIGIGENGHLAFNDPHVADFSDPQNIKVVDLDSTCRQQQVNDGCFATIEDVPTHAYTVTIPTIMSARYIYCIVPAQSKAKAVQATVEGPISPSCPAAILRTHQRAMLYLDSDSASELTLTGRG